jgi:hypothetical protein
MRFLFPDSLAQIIAQIIRVFNAYTQSNQRI